MIIGYLNRIQEDDEGTLGILSFPTLHWSCATIELPWRDNKRGLSRIEAGGYDCEVYHSRKFGTVYILKGVNGRSYILTHYGNWAGDRLKGYITNSEGCILLGYNFCRIRGQKAVGNSRSTFDQYLRKLAGQKFKLIVQ